MHALESSEIREPQESGTAWADRLARCRQPKHAENEAPIAQPLLEAVTALWELFDRACRQANEALERSGVPEQVHVRRASNERHYTMMDPAGSSRTISVSINAPVVNGYIFGGVSIRNSRTRQPITLTPVLEAGTVCWHVASLGIRFTEDLVHDLFLSVFGDDPLATARLSPLSGSAPFETPWR